MNWWAIGATVVITLGIVVAIWRLQNPHNEEDDTWLGT
jgi:hypothetical protein